MKAQLLFILLDVWFTSGVIIGVVTLLPITFLLFCYAFLADKNIFFTFGEENRAMHVMNGKKFSGRVIFPSHTDYIDANYDILPIPDGTPEEKEKYQQDNFFGMYWVGIYPFRKIHFRHQQWQEWQLLNNELTLVPRDEFTPYLITKPFAYGMWLKSAENSEGIPLDLKFTLFLKPTNVVKPVFLNDDAYGQVQGITLSAALLYTRIKTFASMQSDSTVIDNVVSEHDQFSEVLCTLNEIIPGRPDKLGIDDVFGYRATGAKLNSVEVSGDNKTRVLEATTKKYEAEQEKLVVILQGEGQSEAKKRITDAEKYDMGVRTNFYQTIKDMSWAQQIELAKEMFEKSKLTTFVSGKDVVPTINVTDNK